MKKINGAVLADGKVTGHAHRLADQAIEVWETEEATRIFSLTEDTALNHEEHNTITLPAQDYECGIVREYDPLEDGIREVQD